MALTVEDLMSRIRDIPDFPKPGILFKDISPLLQDPDALPRAVDLLAEPFVDQSIDMVMGIESRGFLFGPAVACRLGAGFAPVRKRGKLPAETWAEEYILEYGTDAVEIHKDAVEKGMKVLVVDDLIATGGTAGATVSLLEKCGAQVDGISFLIELSALDGRSKLGSHKVHSVIRY